MTAPGESHFAGRRVLVTGASSGIGRAFARALAARGADLQVTARREERLQELKRELEAAHDVAVVAVPADLTDAGQRRRLLEHVGQALPDILINNAGLGMNRRFLAGDPDRMEHLIRLDLEAPVLLCRDLGGAMAARGHGAVLNVASIAGFIPTPHHAVYAATKAALLIFSEGLDLELRPRGVPVTCFCPGVTDTEFFEAGRYVTKSAVYRMKRMTPEAAAEAGLRALARRRRVHVPGVKNRLLLLAQRLLPRRFVVAAAGRAMSTD